VLEFEERHTIFEQSGKLRVGLFANRGNTGNYRNALAITAANPTLNINDVMTGIQRDNPKYGFYVNAEKLVMKDVGVFARASWNDGQNQIVSFTDIDRSISGGLSVKGSYWGRPSDTIGISGAVNGLSAAHSDFLAAGGLGLLIGDCASTTAANGFRKLLRLRAPQELHADATINSSPIPLTTPMRPGTRMA
jgi:high affinity Mn2+ porin